MVYPTAQLMYNDFEYTVKYLVNATLFFISLLENDKGVFMMCERSHIFWQVKGYFVSKIVVTNCSKQNVAVIEKMFCKFEAECQDFI